MRVRVSKQVYEPLTLRGPLVSKRVSFSALSSQSTEQPSHRIAMDVRFDPRKSVQTSRYFDSSRMRGALILRRQARCILCIVRAEPRHVRRVDLSRKQEKNCPRRAIESQKGWVLHGYSVDGLAAEGTVSGPCQIFEMTQHLCLTRYGGAY